MITRTTFSLVIGIVGLMLLFGTGCELGINPLLFDGRPITAEYRVDSRIGRLDGSQTINPQELLSGIENSVDSVKIINVTLQIDSITDGTDPATTFSGSGSVDNIVLLTVSGAKLSDFSTERSIFSGSLAGLTYSAAGVSHIISMLHQSPLPTSALLAVSGTASTSNLHFTLRLKLYTQVYTRP